MNKKVGGSPHGAASEEATQALEQGFKFHQEGNLEEAGNLYEKILALDPGNAEANHLLGIIALDKSDFATACELIGKAVNTNPRHFIAQNNLGNAFSALGNLAEAEKCYRKALKFKADYAIAHCNLGTVLQDTDRHEDAEKHFRRAVSLQPDYIEALGKLGNALAEKGANAEAAGFLKRAVDLKPGDAGMLNDLGNALKDSNLLEQAREVYHRALAIDPDDAKTNYNLAMSHLIAGDLAEGFKGYEWRWKVDGLVEKRSFAGVRWNGEALEGRTILVYAEQGLGDSIQFCRYLPLLVAGGGKVAFECQPALINLLSGMDENITVFPRGAPPPPYDKIHVPLLSLPQLLGTTLKSLPADTPYLHADAALAEKWDEYFSQYSGPKIGLNWRGGPAHLNDHNRSTTLALFARYFCDPGTHYFSLQIDRPMDENDLPEHFIDLGKSFSDTAAALKHLDLVISVDTAIAHLAGAVGTNVWTLLATPCDWRWLLEREDTPWYPSMKLKRKEAGEDWDALLARVAADLKKEMNGTDG